MADESKISVELRVKQEDLGVTASISFLNTSDSVIFLDTISICLSGEIERNVFNILDSDDNKVHYFGVMMKRKITAEDFVAVNPGSSVETKALLNSVYKIIEKSKYRIKFTVYNPSHPNGQKSFKMESNEVEFVS